MGFLPLFDFHELPTSELRWQELVEGKVISVNLFNVSKALYVFLKYLFDYNLKGTKIIVMLCGHSCSLTDSFCVALNT